MRDRVVNAAWEIRTENGLALDDDAWLQTSKSVSDATANSWQAGMDDAAWLAATLARLPE